MCLSKLFRYPNISITSKVGSLLKRIDDVCDLSFKNVCFTEIVSGKKTRFTKHKHIYRENDDDDI